MPDQLSKVKLLSRKTTPAERVIPRRAPPFGVVTRPRGKRVVHGARSARIRCGAEKQPECRGEPPNQATKEVTRLRRRARVHGRPAKGLRTVLCALPGRATATCPLLLCYGPTRCPVSMRMVGAERRTVQTRQLACELANRRRRERVSRAGIEPATLCLKGRCSTD